MRFSFNCMLTDADYYVFNEIVMFGTELNRKKILKTKILAPLWFAFIMLIYGYIIFEEISLVWLAISLAGALVFGVAFALAYKPLVAKKRVGMLNA